MTKQEVTRRFMCRPYKPKTVARLYAQWLNQHERPICYLYLKNNSTHAVKAGEVLRLSLGRSIHVVEVDPKNFLGRYQP